MDHLIDMLLANPLFIIILLGGVYSLLKGKPNEEEEKKQQTQTRQQRQTKPGPTSSQTRQQQAEQASQRASSNPNGRETVAQTAPLVTEQRKSMEQVVSQLKAAESLDVHSGLKNRPKVADARRAEEIKKHSTAYKQAKFKKDFNHSLTKTGLVNSVIMSEVLGPPRARNPYASVVEQRRKK